MEVAIEVAAEWLEVRLQEDEPGVTRVIYHFIVLQYLSDERHDQLRRVIGEIGERATRTSPFGWLCMESAGGHTCGRLTTSPDGEDRLPARAGFHGEIVHLLSN